MKALSISLIAIVTGCLSFGALAYTDTKCDVPSYETTQQQVKPSQRTFTCPYLKSGHTYHYGYRTVDVGGKGYWYLWIQGCKKSVTITDNFSWSLFQVVDKRDQGGYIQLFCTTKVPRGCNNYNYNILIDTNLRAYGAQSCSSNGDGTFTCSY